MSGRCLCGAVTVTMAAHGGFTGACHCRMCQRWTGGLYLSFPARPEDVAFEGPVKVYRSSGFAERGFCGVCGSHLWFRDLAEGATWGIMPGQFDAARDIPLRSEIYVDRALPGLALAGDHRRATRAEYEAKNPHTDGEMP
jgi:hypothetical protein